MIAAITTSTLVAAVGFHTLVVVLLAIAVSLCFRPLLWLPLLAVFLGLLTGFIDLLSHEVQLPALMLLASSFFVAFARPLHPWRWALLIGVWLPAGGLIQQLALKTSAPPPGHAALSLLALVPAMLGAYGGAFAASMGARGQTPSALSEHLKLEEE